jgi:hypothetical protein
MRISKPVNDALASGLNKKKGRGTNVCWKSAGRTSGAVEWRTKALTSRVSRDGASLHSRTTPTHRPPPSPWR